MLVREQTELLEQQTLAPWAAHSADSKGRDRAEPPCPVRTAFQRDRDRIIHSKSFRRLAYKTQAFIAPEGDHYRTRLTHSLEVAQIARTIARALRLNEDLTEAIALGHDLGHTPFGHHGEAALDRALRRARPGEHFRHYQQSLRVVERLERAGRGLNLTWEVRDGILHHSKGRDNLPKVRRDAPATLEGQVVMYADRIAYVNHDVDDAVRAKLIREEDIPRFGRRRLRGPSARLTLLVLDVVAASGEGAVRMSPDVLAWLDSLKEFLFTQVYLLPQTSSAGRRAGEMVAALFARYLEEPGLLPAEPPAEPDLALRVRDYVAGMTDRFAQAEYGRLFGAATLLNHLSPREMLCLPLHIEPEP